MRSAATNQYHLTTLWRLGAPVETVWDVITHPEHWPDWWAGAESVVSLEDGDADGVGARQQYIWKGRLPYRLRFISCVTRVERHRLLEAKVAGEVEGIGRWHFVFQDGATTLRYEWLVRTNPLWMNVLAPLARPVFRWNHNALMRAGGIGLARHLGAPLHRHESRSA
ncbi:SRPBCC family protein [Aromatoleum evansii]|uniref:SRPBCC family protein n=1 Tax=Aromatoleum evansii TaxID=59406 RepID=A0ABZ1AH81_AROEV|nr:SRPBCC family protein [Aromatoleum evansii]NMG30803.1 polyketide cyclase [Aromatoleum evansii]WRL45228.1 SRPBCC family protein [Aromatoleum evansii]